MISFIYNQPVLIQKVRKPRKPWKKTRTYSRLNKLTHSMSGAVRINFKDGITRFSNRVKPDEIYDAWLSRNYAKMYETIPWDKLPGDLSGYGDSIGSVLEGNGLETIKLLPQIAQKNLRWNMSNPRIRSYVDNRVGSLVTNITQETQSFIASTIARSYDTGLTARRVASMIKPAIGLGNRLGIAHANYVEGLRQQGLSDNKIQTLGDRYEDKLLDYRSFMIARTESSYARNQGQLSVWKAAADQDLIDRQTAKKEWIVDGNPCAECLDIEDQGPIGLEESWDSDDGPIDAPPAHPNCMCGMDMTFEEATEPTDDEEG